MKRVLILICIVLAIIVPLTVFSASNAPDSSNADVCKGRCRIDPSSLTEQQKNELLDSFRKMMEVRKKIINELVQSGKITKDEGDKAIKRIDEKIERSKKNGLPGGFGRQKEFNGKRDFGRRQGRFKDAPAPAG